MSSLNHPQTVKQYQFQYPELEIGNFSYLITIDGHKTLSITGNRLVVQKKKLGLFRFALWRELLIDNASFVLDTVADDDANSTRGSSLNSNVSAYVAAILPGNVPLGVECRPVSFTVKQVGGAGLVSCIWADAAQLTAKVVRFRGHVRVKVGSVGLQAEGLDLYPAESRMEVEKNYTLITEQGEKIAGYGLKSDVFLTSLTRLDN